MNLDSVLDLINVTKEGDTVLMTTISDVKLTGGKKNPLQNKVKKRVTDSRVMLNCGNLYQSLVTESLINEGKEPEAFTPHVRPWGKRVDNTPIIEHNGQYYLETIFVSNGNVEYLVDDTVTNKEEIEGLPESKVSDDSQGGLANKVIVRTHKLDSIVCISINDKLFS